MKTFIVLKVVGAAILFITLGVAPPSVVAQRGGQFGGGSHGGGGFTGSGGRGGGSAGGGSSYHGGGYGGWDGGHGIRTGPPNGFIPHHSGFHHRPGYGTVWLPWNAPYWDDDGYSWDGSSYQQSANTTSPQIIVVENKESRLPAPPLEPSKVIEVPQSKEAPVAKQQAPTVFVLKDGGRLESGYYLLTIQSLKIEVGRQQRTIPVSRLNLDATIAANHERGIEVSIPRDRSIVFLGF
ncbi:MAG: hypothetical protein P4M04_11230 [Acidobacteriota bacterium]|nr:hypothetical protein [Acidobacteriota bacterium]